MLSRLALDHFPYLRVLYVAVSLSLPLRFFVSLSLHLVVSAFLAVTVYLVESSPCLGALTPVFSPPHKNAQNHIHAAVKEPCQQGNAAD